MSQLSVRSVSAISPLLAHILNKFATKNKTIENFRLNLRPEITY